MTKRSLRIAIVGAGWAGCSAAVHATQQGAQVSIFESNGIPGGRARSLTSPHFANTQNTPNIAIPENGQHILIGAYSETIRLMRSIGVAIDDVLERLPLDLRTPNQHGLCMPQHIQNPQLAVLYAVCTAKGWAIKEKLQFLQLAAQWTLQKFSCNSNLSVAELCQKLSPRIQQSLIEPLCLSAFNTPPEHTSGTVFLRVLHDALLLQRGGSDVLLARKPLGNVLPEPAVLWLQQQQAQVHMGQRVQRIVPLADNTWHIYASNTPEPQKFGAVILACASWEAAKLVQGYVDADHNATQADAVHWVDTARALQYNPIATVYAWCNAHDCAHLPPMQALHAPSNTHMQFVFHHPQYTRTNANGTAQVLLAFVCSYCQTDRKALEHNAYEQAQNQLNITHIEIMQTLIERRATFVCSPALQRPSMHIAPNLLACGDYIAGDYPSTLEGAVRSGLTAAQAVCAA